VVEVDLKRAGVQSDAEPKRVLIVDAHVAVLHGLRLMLQSEFPGNHIGRRESGRSAGRKLPRGMGDSLLSTSAGRKKRRDLTGKNFASILPSMLSSYTQCIRSRPMWRARLAAGRGANGFVNKDQPPRETFEAIRTVLSEEFCEARTG